MPTTPRADTKVQRWKTKVADARRQNLETGLNELWARRRKSDEIRNRRVRGKFAEYNAARVAPEREDDRLTRSTIHDAMLDTQVYPDVDRFDRAKKSRENVQRINDSKREARQDALVELYMNASNFIVTEQELKNEIETIFAEDYFSKMGETMARYGQAQNAWGIYGPPTSIANMLETTSGTSTRVVDIHDTEYDRSVKRQKRIAEEFTGGKME